MARKRRLPYECQYCGTRKQNAQAIRGHLTHCKHRRRRLQAGAEAQAEPGAGLPPSGGSLMRGRRQCAEAGASDSLRRRSGPLSRENRLLLLDVQEMLEQHQQTARELMTMAHILANMNAAGQREQAQEWLCMYQTFDDCLRDLDPMVPLFELDRAVLFRIYNAIRRLKIPWLLLRIGTCSRPQLEPDGLDEESRTILREDEASFLKLIGLLKQLVAAAP